MTAKAVKKPVASTGKKPAETVTYELSPVLAMLERAYDAINARYYNSSLDRPIITIQSRAGTYGHFRSMGWKAEEATLPEINIAAGDLDRPIDDLFATLNHEMVHQFCLDSGIQDTSRGGAYHNKHFKEQAELRGLVISKDSRVGWSTTKPAPEFSAWSKAFAKAVGLHALDSMSLTGGSRSSSTRKYVCPVCGMSVRATKAVNIGCLDCNAVMVAADAVGEGEVEYF
ncbi:MAG: hypothetical protein LBP28_05715 [Coriobacteriales bacterium]|jgi:hypothetical protein|nr:hypothetical protein [Coriobacteriales bacterium]